MVTRLRKTYDHHGGVDEVELRKALKDLNSKGM